MSRRPAKDNCAAVPWWAAIRRPAAYLIRAFGERTKASSEERITNRSIEAACET